MFALPKIISDLYAKITKTGIDANAYADVKFKENSHDIIVGTSYVDPGSTFEISHDLKVTDYYVSFTPLSVTTSTAYAITKSDNKCTITNNGSEILIFDYQIFS